MNRPKSFRIEDPRLLNRDQARNDKNIRIIEAAARVFALGQNYVSGHLQIVLHPLVKVSLTAINNIEDPSGILQPYAVWDITQNLQIIGGLNISCGDKGTEFGGFKLPGTDLRNKAPDSAYLWFIYYF